MDALSDRDKGSMAELVAEYFCSAPDNPLDDDGGGGGSRYVNTGNMI